MDAFGSTTILSTSNVLTSIVTLVNGVAIGYALCHYKGMFRNSEACTESSPVSSDDCDYPMLKKQSVSSFTACESDTSSSSSLEISTHGIPKVVSEGSDEKQVPEYEVLEGAIELFRNQWVTKSRQVGSNPGKVVDYFPPQELIKKLFSSSNPELNFSLDETSPDPQHLLKLFSTLQEYSVNTSHPYFFNQLFGALDPISLASELIAVGLNTSAYTFETAPLFTLMEKEIVSKLVQMLFKTQVETV